MRKVAESTRENQFVRFKTMDRQWCHIWILYEIRRSIP